MLLISAASSVLTNHASILGCGDRVTAVAGKAGLRFSGYSAFILFFWLGIHPIQGSLAMLGAGKAIEAHQDC